jgi:uncharacterized membrane protein
MKRFFERHLDDVLIVSGAGLVVYGTWLLSEVGALFVAGAFLIGFGVLIGLGAGRGGGSQ